MHKLPITTRIAADGSGTGLPAISLVADASNADKTLFTTARPPPLIFVNAIENEMEFAAICDANVPPTTVPLVIENTFAVVEAGPAVPLSTLLLEAKLTSSSLTLALS